MRRSYLILALSLVTLIGSIESGCSFHELGKMLNANSSVAFRVSIFLNSMKTFYQSGGTGNYLDYFRRLPSEGVVETKYYEEYVKSNYTDISVGFSGVHYSFIDGNNSIESRIDSLPAIGVKEGTLLYTITQFSVGNDWDGTIPTVRLFFTISLRGRLLNSQDMVIIEKNRIECLLDLRDSSLVVQRFDLQ